MRTDYESGPHTKYGNVKYTVSELRNCSGACHIYTDSTLTTISRSRPGPQHRVTSSVVLISFAMRLLIAAIVVAIAGIRSARAAGRQAGGCRRCQRACTGT